MSSAATARARNLDLKTIEFGASYLKLSPRTIRRYIALGILPAYKVGPTQIRVNQADLDALIRKVPAAEAAS